MSEILDFSDSYRNKAIQDAFDEFEVIQNGQVETDEDGNVVIHTGELHEELRKILVSSYMKFGRNISEWARENDGFSNNALPVIRDDSTISERSIHEISVSDTGHVVKVQGQVMDKTANFPRYMRMEYMCGKGHTFQHRQTRLQREISKPLECHGHPDCGSKQFKRVRPIESIDSQQIIIQENLQSGETAELLVELPRNFINEIDRGDDITAYVHLHERESEKSNRGEIIGFLAGFERENVSYADVEVSDEDLQEIISLSSSAEVYSTLTNSIAPHIVGDDYELAKRCLAYALFGGVDLANQRPSIHTLLVGDPGTAKSALVKWLAEVAPRGEYADSKGASGVGLTASTTRKDSFDFSEYRVTPGVLPRNHEGIVAIDELDKAQDSKLESLNEAMSQGEVNVKKGDARATLPAETTVIGAANPKDKRFDRYGRLAEQIGFEEVDEVLDRFDLILPFVDEVKENEQEHADAILQARGNDEGEVSKDLLRRYVAYARRNIEPELSEEAREYITEKYDKMRNAGNDEVISVTQRNLMTMVRLAEASARIRLSEDVEIEDAKRSYDLYRRVMAEWSDEASGGYSDLAAERLSTGSVSPKNRALRAVRAVLPKVDGLDEGDGLPVRTVKVLCEGVDEVDEDEIEWAIEQLEDEGTISVGNSSGSEMLAVV